MASNIKGITIEIGGNAEKLEKSLSDVYKKSKSLTGEMKEIDKAMRFNPKNIELAGQKQKVLSEQVENTRNRLDELKKAQEQVNEQYKNGEISEQQYRAFQREIIETESILKNYEGKLSDLTDKHKILGDKLEEIGGKFKNVGQKMQDVGGAMTKGVTAPILAVGAASYGAFLKVDEALDTIVTKTGATGDAMVPFKESFEKVGRTVPTDLQNVGDAIGEINTQFGSTGEELEDLSTQMIQFAEINGVDITNSSIKAKQAMEAFGMTTEDVPGILDAVTVTAQNTGQSTDSLFDSVIKGGPQLKALGLGFAESSTLMGQFEQSGVDSTKALSYLSRSTVQFAKDGLTLEEGLSGLIEEINNTESETDKLSLASEYFGTKGATFMLDAIQRGALDMDELASASENAAGTVANTFEETLDPADRMKLVMNDLLLAGSDLSLAIQSALAPMLEKVSEKIRIATGWFQGLDEEQQQMIVKIGLVAAAIGPALIVFGKMASGIGSIVSVGGTLISSFGALSGAGGALATGLSSTVGFLFSPAGAILVGIAAVVAGGVWLYKNWDTVKEKAGQLKESVSEKWTSLKENTSEAWSNMKDSISNKMEEASVNTALKMYDIGTSVSTKMGESENVVIQKMGGIVSAFSENFLQAHADGNTILGSIQTGVSNTFGQMKDKVAEKMLGVASEVRINMMSSQTEFGKNAGMILSKASTTFQQTYDKTGSIFGAMKTTMNATMGDAKNLVLGEVDKMKNNMINKIVETKNNTINRFNELKTGTTNKISETVSNIGSKFSEVYEKIMSPVNRAKDALSNAIDRMKSFFNFEWSLPKLKMPHFSVSGKFSLNPPSIPSFGIDWYADGGILTKPTLFGAMGNQMLGGGEYRTGGEAIMPLNRLPQLMAEAMEMARGNDNQTTIVQVYLGEEDVTDLITDRVDNNLNKRAERNRRGKRV